MRVVEYADLLPRVPVVERFVYSAFCQGSAEPDSVLTDLLAQGARVVVAVGADDDTFYGWAAALDGVVIWSYTKNLRHMKDDGSEFRLRGHGVCKALLAELGFSKEKPVPVLYDSPAAKRFARNGWQIQLVGALPAANDNARGIDEQRF